MSKKSELNELVLEYQTSKNQTVFLKIHAFAVDIAMIQKRKIQKNNHGDPYYFDSAFGISLMKSINKYNYDAGDFENFFSTNLANQIKDELMLDYKEYTSKNPYYNPDDNSNEIDEDKNKKRNMVGRLDDESEKNKEQYNSIQDTTTLSQLEEFEKDVELYDCVLDIVKAIQDKKKNSRTTCWDTYFFTEMVSHKISENTNMYKYISYKSNRYLSAISLDFINSYTKTKCTTLKDVRNAKLKSARDFGLTIDGPCGYGLKNEVYAQYFSVTTSAVVQQRGHYHSRIKEIFNKT